MDTESGTRIIGLYDFPATKDLEFCGVGPEQLVWWGKDALIYSKNDKDIDMVEYNKGLRSCSL